MVAAVAQRPRSKIPLEAVVAQLRDGVHAMSDWVREANGQELGEGLIQIREAGIDPLEAVFATGVRRFDRSGEYRAEGALSLIAWLRWKCKLSGGGKPGVLRRNFSRSQALTCQYGTPAEPRSRCPIGITDAGAVRLGFL